jgi:hypothetical protein
MNECWNLSRFIIARERCLHALVLPKWMQFDEALAPVSRTRAASAKTNLRWAICSHKVTGLDLPIDLHKAMVD